MSKWKCENPNCKKPCYAEPPEHCYPTVCLLSRNNTANWREEAEPVTNCNQLPKLTAEVFNRPDCPEWAKYAAVDRSGVAFFYENKPICTGTCYQSIIGATKIIDSSIKWDIANYQNILIERPAELPEWCDVGEYIWNKSEKRYFKIKVVKNGVIEALPLKNRGFGLWHISDFSNRNAQARIRPYNAEEMRGLVGKVIEGKDEISVIADYSRDNNKIYFIGGWSSADEILKQGYTIDGKPCGVLEHLENEEWVE